MKHLFRTFLILALGCGLLLLAGCDSKETAETPKAAPAVDQGEEWAKEYTAKLQDFYANTNGTMTVGSISVDGKTSSYVLQDVAGSLRLMSDGEDFPGVKIDYTIASVEVDGVNGKPFAEDKLFANKTTWKDFSYSYDLSAVAGVGMGKVSATAKEYVFNGMQGDMDALMDILKKGETSMADLAVLSTLAAQEMTFNGVASTATMPTYGDQTMKFSATIDSGFAKDVAFIRCGASEVLDYKIFLDDKLISTTAKYSLKSFVLGDKPEQIVALLLGPEQAMEMIPNVSIDNLRGTDITVHLQDQGFGDLTIADSGISMSFAQGKGRMALDATSIVIPKEMEDMASLFILGSGSSLSELHEGSLDLSFAIDVGMEEKDGKTHIDASNIFIGDKNLGSLTFNMNIIADTLAATPPEPFGDMENLALVRAFLKIVDTGMIEFGSRLASTQAMPDMNPADGASAMRGMGIALLDAQCKQFTGTKAELCANALALLKEPGTLEITVAPPTPISLDADPTELLFEQGEEILGVSSSFKKN